MYTPAHFDIQDRAELVAFMRRYNFATIVSAPEGNLTGAHAPLVVRESGGEITLVGHLSKAGLPACFSDVLVIFNGPHAYVSPSLYESTLSVPTWNYTAVHAYGTARPVDAEAALMELVNAMEPAYRKQWGELPEEFRAKMIGGVTAFEIPVKRLEGKYKLSQNRPVSDQLRVTEAFCETELGEFMRKIRR
jgi:transcriptional regulator